MVQVLPNANSVAVYRVVWDDSLMRERRTRASPSVIPSLASCGVTPTAARGPRS